jgi:hypothetical protein
MADPQRNWPIEDLKLTTVILNALNLVSEVWCDTQAGRKLKELRLHEPTDFVGCRALSPPCILERRKRAAERRKSSI